MAADCPTPGYVALETNKTKKTPKIVAAIDAGPSP
jgi:hypothetical protein